MMIDSRKIIGEAVKEFKSKYPNETDEQREIRQSAIRNLMKRLSDDFAERFSEMLIVSYNQHPVFIIQHILVNSQTGELDFMTLSATKTGAMLNAITGKRDAQSDMSDELIKQFFDVLFKDRGKIVEIKLSWEYR